MALEAYRQKRRFERTPEPRGPARRPRAKGSRLRFVVQEHAATRLHYDFRLELDGVLKSWAVPKGPSLDPTKKQLAVAVEDHPLEYGGFEGKIPEGEYGGGTVLLWDRGTWEPVGDPKESLRKGRLSFTLHGEKLEGGFHLVRLSGDPKSWLLMKRRDAWAKADGAGEVVARRPESVASGRVLGELVGQRRGKVWHSGRAGAAPAPRRGGGASSSAELARLEGVERGALPTERFPQLATLAREAPAGDEWLHELKYDGYRVLSRLERGRVAMITRGGLDWSDRFAPLAEALRRVPVKSALLDGEVAVVQEDGSTSFQALQNQLRGGAKELVYFVFDLLHLDGFDLTGAPLESRKAVLKRLLDAEGVPRSIHFGDHVVGQGPRFHAEVCRRGLEGIVSKRRDSKSVPARTASWVKVKCSSRQELVIGGYTEPSGARSGFGALLLGVHDGAKGLTYCGKVGTGFSEATLGALLEKLERLETARSPFTERPPDARHTHWVEPKLVAEVAFQSWTDDGRLRQPSFLGLREDKPAAEVVREEQRPPPRPAAKPARVTEARFGDLTLTHPDRVLFPEAGLTKLTVARYLRRVAPLFLAHAVGRPLVLVRCPETREDCFYQKHPGAYVPRALGTVRVREKHGHEIYLVLRDEAGLYELAQLGVIETHLWGAPARDVDAPDRLVFDFDPDPASPWQHVAEGALRMRQLLAGLDLISFVKTTGGKGLHVVVPLRLGPSWDELKVFSLALASLLVGEAPERFTTHLVKARRGGRIFIDTLRNRRGSTWVAPYSPRARAGAPVSMPIEWKVLERDERPRFDVQGVLDRGGPLTDAWAAMHDVRQSLTRTKVQTVLAASQG